MNVAASNKQLRLLCGKLLLSDRWGKLRHDVQQGALHHYQGLVVQHANAQEVLWEQVGHGRAR